MSHFEYEDSNYWEKVYALDAHSHAMTEGNDGELEFGERMVGAAIGKSVLDVGCGDGSFTAMMAAKAKGVVGIDFSKTAISNARKNAERKSVTNLRFEVGRADSLRFPRGTFDLVTCRRGPVSAKAGSLSEAYRVLRRGGVLMEITIGERNMENIARIFGRGQMLGSEKVSVAKRRMLREAGFEPVEIKDYQAVEIFRDIDDLVIRLKNSPIIPDFDPRKDREHLREIELRCKSPRGIETQAHRVTIIARKR